MNKGICALSPNSPKAGLFRPFRVLAVCCVVLAFLAGPALAQDGQDAQDAPPAGTPVMTLTVQAGATVHFEAFGAENAPTSVWIESAPGRFTHTVVNMPTALQATAQGTSINIYGAIAHVR